MDPEVRNALRLGAYQILFTRIPGYAACNSSVELVRDAGNRRAPGFVNGVLRALVRGADDISYPDPGKEPVRWISVTESHPEWMVQWWMDRNGFEDTLAWCRANNRPPESVLRINRLRADPGDLEPLGVKPCAHAPDGFVYRGGGNPAEREAYRKGLYSIQSEASQLVTCAGGVDGAWRMLDGCAGRGGKSTYLAELSGDAGEVLAVDIYPDKLRVLEAQSERLGLKSVHTLSGDLRALEPISGSRDLVVLDVPCSGLGTIGREADARWHKSPEMLRDLPDLQLDLLRAGAPWVRPGGLLLYVTCSVAPEENLQVVEGFLQASEEFLPENIDAALPGTAGYTMHLYPHVHGTDGSFAALMRRRQ